jgi:SAM-dependent methyltransferase
MMLTGSPFVRHRELPVKGSPHGFAYLNVGCGTHYSAEWNNLDLHPAPQVARCDVTRPLPYPAAVFDTVYSSHVLEHLAPRDGQALMREAYRVLKPGGILRLVVPDLERICRDYLSRLEAVAEAASEANIRRYRWITLELLDQLVRERPGGMLGHAVAAGEVDIDDVRQRVGAELAAALTKFHARPVWKRAAVAVLDRVGLNPRSPQRSGEVHRWMYDRISLRLLLERVGFEHFEVMEFDRSSIPFWETYQLDRAIGGRGPRKPDSLFVEVLRPR